MKSNSYLQEVFGYSVGQLAKQKLNGEFEGYKSIKKKKKKKKKKTKKTTKKKQIILMHKPLTTFLPPPDGPSNYYVIQNELPEDFRKQCGLLDLEVSVSTPALTLMTLVATCINIKGGKISESEFFIIIIFLFLFYFIFFFYFFFFLFFLFLYFFIFFYLFIFIFGIYDMPLYPFPFQSKHSFSSLFPSYSPLYPPKKPPSKWTLFWTLGKRAFANFSQSKVSLSSFSFPLLSFSHFLLFFFFFFFFFASPYPLLPSFLDIYTRKVSKMMHLKMILSNPIFYIGFFFSFFCD